MNPQDPLPAPLDFAISVREAFVGYHTYKQTAEHALDIGVCPTDLVRYVRGVLTARERDEVQSLIARSPWAMDRVVALVKARRDPNNLGSRILIGEPFAWDVQRTDDLDTDEASLLNTV